MYYIPFKSPEEFFQALGLPCRSEEEVNAAYRKRLDERRIEREEASKRVAAEAERIIEDIRSNP